jgi:N-methylhydantoinase B
VLIPGYITHEGGRHVVAPWGILSGADGRAGRCTTTSPGRPGAGADMPSKVSGLAAGADGVMSDCGPNGGGYGDPLDRPPVRVPEHALDGFYGARPARDACGVIVDAGVETLDREATGRLRRP